MKKNIVRALAFVLVLILALGIIPLGAFAAVNVRGEAYSQYPNYSYDDYLKYCQGYWNEAAVPTTGGSATIKTSNYDSLILGGDGKKYDLQGIVDHSKSVANKPLVVAPSLNFHDGDTAYLLYTPHNHSLSYWYSDNTTHWRECLSCKRVFGEHYQFMFQNWHSDGDEDRVCDVCGHDIPYHEIDVEEVKGGKITVELDEAPHRKKIVATAEPEEGYKLKKIHFIKVRDNGTEQEITRRKTSTKGTWWAYMPTYDLKVTAEFVKKK